MMKLETLIKFSFISLLVLGLAGCNELSTKPDSSAGTEASNELDLDSDLLALRKRADEAYLSDDLKSSEKDYETLIKRMPEEALHWFRLANIYVRTNRPQQAIDLYREAVIRDPAYSKAWYNLSIVQLKQTAYSLSEMLAYTDKNDPLHKKARSMLQGIETIIKVD